MSATPKTDAAAGLHPGQTVPADFCRQLEIECNQLKSLAMRLRVLTILSSGGLHKNYQDQLNETLADFNKLMNSY